MGTCCWPCKAILIYEVPWAARDITFRPCTTLQELPGAIQNHFGYQTLNSFVDHTWGAYLCQLCLEPAVSFVFIYSVS